MQDLLDALKQLTCADEAYARAADTFATKLRAFVAPDPRPDVKLVDVLVQRLVGEDAITTREILALARLKNALGKVGASDDDSFND